MIELAYKRLMKNRSWKILDHVWQFYTQKLKARIHHPKKKKKIAHLLVVHEPVPLSTKFSCEWTKLRQDTMTLKLQGSRLLDHKFNDLLHRWSGDTKGVKVIISHKNNSS